MVEDFGKVMYTLLHLKWITNKNLPYIACGTLLNVVHQPRREGDLGKNGYMHIYG